MEAKNKKLKKLFLLSWKKIGVLILLAVASIILHNTVGAVFNTEEAFFFILVIFVLPSYLLVSIIVSTINTQIKD